MRVGVEDRIEAVGAGVEQLAAQVGRRVDQDARRALVDQDRAAPAPVARVVGGADPAAAADHRHPARGAAAEDGDPHEVSGGRARLGEQPEEVRAGRPLDLGDRQAADLGEPRSDVGDVGRLVALAAKRLGREIGRVGLEQQALERHLAHRGAQLVRALEREDAAEAEVEAELERPQRQLWARAVAVDHAREAAGRHLLLEDPDRVLVGIAGVDHERQPALPRGRDVDAKHPRLHVLRAVLVVVVEPALADADDLRMVGEGEQRAGVVERLLRGVVRMHAERAVDALIGLGEREHRLDAGEPGADRLHHLDAGGAGARADPCPILREPG